MMQALLVTCHPLQDSLSHHLADQARISAEKAGHMVQTLDLAALDFDPRLAASHRL